ncbi:hypothetical protein MKW94_006803 [Papaver nudicaule]|uniref:Uncharacterized protein n=1 Tax=Papaver nudicaule TaxID=74823 RepID=A0AA41SDT5_PAPNU|nr:hypothetical protein [Papaver nudicaule]
MASRSSSPIRLFLFAMLALPAYSEMVNELKCPRPEDSYSWAKDTDCRSCAKKCASNCLSLKKGARQLGCTDYAIIKTATCDCCCTPLTPPPPPPPPPPPLVPIKDTCVQPGDKYSETTYATLNCNDCDNWCKNDCSKQGAEVVNKKCSIPGQSQWLRRCECCCNKNAKPSPPPPRPPAPTPSRDTCDKPGDIYTETTMTSSDCSFCKNWCKDDCSELKGEVVSNKCSMGESKFVTRCKCCCNEKSVLKVNTVKEMVRLNAH